MEFVKNVFHQLFDFKFKMNPICLVSIYFNISFIGRSINIFETKQIIRWAMCIELFKRINNNEAARTFRSLQDNSYSSGPFRTIQIPLSTLETFHLGRIIQNLMSGWNCSSLNTTYSIQEEDWYFIMWMLLLFVKLPAQSKPGS